MSTSIEKDHPVQFLERKPGRDRQRERGDICLNIPIYIEDIREPHGACIFLL